jgi:hypothetical protein
MTLLVRGDLRQELIAGTVLVHAEATPSGLAARVEQPGEDPGAGRVSDPIVEIAPDDHEVARARHRHLRVLNLPSRGDDLLAQPRRSQGHKEEGTG